MVMVSCASASGYALGFTASPVCKYMYASTNQTREIIHTYGSINMKQMSKNTKMREREERESTIAFWLLDEQRREKEARVFSGRRKEVLRAIGLQELIRV